MDLLLLILLNKKSTVKKIALLSLIGNEFEDVIKTKFSYDNGINWDALSC